jgi:Holliday junction DNA helicase RuvA
LIAALKGNVLDKGLHEAIVDVNGVGYRVGLSLLSLARLPESGQPVALRIRTVVREDALDLYGFLSAAEEEMFLLLTSVSQVGPKLAMGVLSGLELGDLVQAIGHGEVARLTKIHGVGKKTAERLVLELKDKVKLLSQGPTPYSGAKAAASSGARADLVSALVNLGYKPAQAEKAADAALSSLGQDAAFEALFREGLKALRSHEK